MIQWLTADVFDGLATLEDGSIDLVVTSPPFLALRSYLPADHPDKGREIGSEATPAEFLDVMLRVTAELRRVLAPHGSIAVELGDTYAGSGGAGGDYGENGLREGQPTFKANPGRNSGTRYQKPGMPSIPARERQDDLTKGGDGWPLAKSKTLIPELFRVALAYGFNPLTGEESPAGKWRVRNVVTWCRPNPPVGALGDKWRPATSDVVVACVSGKRFWDDLATRRVGSDVGVDQPRNRQAEPSMSRGGNWSTFPGRRIESFGAPLLDYWEIPPTGYAGAHYAVYPPALVEPLVKAMVPMAVCLDCGTALASSNASTNTDTATGDVLRGMFGADNGGVGQVAERTTQTPLLFQDLRQSEHGQEPEFDKGLGSDSEGIYRSVGADSPDGTQVRLHTGAPNGDGRADWQDAAVRRGGPSHQRGSGRQPTGEPSTGREATARHSNEGVAHQQLPSLRRVRSSEEPCPACGGTLRRGRVLDPFAGSGTTLAVASGHGHDAIGFDLDPRNEELARDRVGPLLWQEA